MTVTVKQGATTLATHSVSMGTPGSDLPDIKISDNTPPSFTQIGTVGNNNPMIMKVVSEDDSIFRILHVYIDVPIGLNNIDAPGPTSLFSPAEPSLISVEVTNATFSNNNPLLPLIVNNNSFFTLFMRDMAGRFYELPQTNPYNAFGNGVIDVQVPGAPFLDGNSGQYSFSRTVGAVPSWAWQNIVNPGPSGTVHNGTSAGQPSAGGGYVFEVGLAVAFVTVPEPATILFVAGGCLILFRRRMAASLTPRPRQAA